MRDAASSLAGALLLVATSALLASCVQRRRMPRTERPRPTLVLDHRARALPFDARVREMEDALGELGAEPIGASRERELGAHTLVALESLDLVAGERYLVTAIGEGLDELRLVLRGAHGESFADRTGEHIGLGPDGWLRFEAPRTERARLRFHASRAGRVTLLVHRLGDVDIDPRPALDASGAAGLTRDFGRVDSEMRARGYAIATAPSVGLGSRGIRVNGVTPGECYAVVVVVSGREPWQAHLTRIEDDGRTRWVDGGEAPARSILCPSGPVRLRLEARHGSRERRNAVALYRRAVSVRAPACAANGFCSEPESGARWTPPQGAPVLLHQEGYALRDAFRLSAQRPEEFTFRAGECYAIATAPGESVQARVAGVSRTLPSPDALFYTRCPERDERLQLSYAEPEGSQLVEVFRRVGEPLDELLADRWVVGRSEEERRLALAGYVQQPFATWTGQELRVDATLTPDACYAVFVETPARVEASVRFGDWERHFAGSGELALRFCPGAVGQHTVHVQATAPLSEPPNVRFYRRDAGALCAGSRRPMHTRMPSWIGQGSSVRLQRSRILRRLRSCQSSGERLQHELGRYLRYGDLEGGPIPGPRRFPALLPVGSLECQEEAERAPFESPPLESAERWVQRISLAGRAVDAVLDEVNRYYQQRRYLDDGMAWGRAVHPMLVEMLQAGACAYEELMRDQEAVGAVYDRGVLEALEAGRLPDALDEPDAEPNLDDLRVRQRVLVAARAATRGAYAVLEGEPGADAAMFDAHRRALEVAVERSQAHTFEDCVAESAHGDEHGLVAAALAFSRAAAEDLRRGMENAAAELHRALREQDRAYNSCPRIRP